MPKVPIPPLRNANHSGGMGLDIIWAVVDSEGASCTCACTQSCCCVLGAAAEYLGACMCLQRCGMPASAIAAASFEAAAVVETATFMAINTRFFHWHWGYWDEGEEFFFCSMAETKEETWNMEHEAGSNRTSILLITHSADVGCQCLEVATINERCCCCCWAAQACLQPERIRDLGPYKCSKFPATPLAKFANCRPQVQKKCSRCLNPFSCAHGFSMEGPPSSC